MCDEEVAAVRKVRHEISEECMHDVHKVAAYYRAVGKQIRLSGEFHHNVAGVNPLPIADPSTAAVYEVLSQSSETGETDLAARHREHQP